MDTQRQIRYGELIRSLLSDCLLKEDFFEEEENKIEFGNLTWSDMSEYQKKYSELLNKYQKNYKDNKELTRFVDSVIMIEYPIIDDFVNKIFKFGYD